MASASERGHAEARAALAGLSCEREYVAACCMGCGASRKLKTCAKCKVARFCGAECVRRLWAEHKPHCMRWEAEARVVAEESSKRRRCFDHDYSLRVMMPWGAQQSAAAYGRGTKGW